MIYRRRSLRQLAASVRLSKSPGIDAANRDTSSHRRGRSQRRGATTVEFALVAPIVLFLVIGMVEYVNVEFLRQGISEAAYEGARQGIVRGASEDEVREATARKLRMLGLSSFDIDIELRTTTVDVLVDVPLRGNSFGVSNFITLPSLQARYRLDREKS